VNGDEQLLVQFSKEKPDDPWPVGGAEHLPLGSAQFTCS